MLFALIDLHNLYANPDGWFFRSNKDLQDDADLSQNLVKVVLDTLYRSGIINVSSVGKGKSHTSNRIHINFESFIKYEAYSFNEIRNNPDLRIITLPYKDHHTPSYCERVGDKESEGVSETLREDIGEKMTTILDTTDTPDTSYSKENILYNTNTEDITPFERYLQGFIDEYPYINYQYSPERFNREYYQQLLDFQTIIRNETARVLPIEELSLYLHYYKTTGKVFEY